MYTDEYYADKNQGQWGYGHQNPVVHIGEASKEIQQAETIDDIDVDKANEAYNKAREELITYLGKALPEEAESVNDIADDLK